MKDPAYRSMYAAADFNLIVKWLTSGGRLVNVGDQTLIPGKQE